MKSSTAFPRRFSRLLFAALSGLLSINAAKAQLVLDFSANTGSTIQFNGSADSFQFTPGINGSQWHITDEPVGTGVALNLNGSITGGPFTYGAVTPGLVQSAEVIGPLGVFTISDGNGSSLTGSIDFMTVDTFYSAGVLDGGLNINLTNLSYSGTNADLKTLVADQPGTLNLGFVFPTSESLSTLSQGSSSNGITSYSGGISEVPEPSAYAMMIVGFALLGCWVVRRKLEHSR